MSLCPPPAARTGVRRSAGERAQRASRCHCARHLRPARGCGGRLVSAAAALVVALILIAGNGLFVAAEFSLLSVNRSTVEKAARNGDAGAAGVLRAVRSLTTQLS